jgi:predicted DCC family thiol-disulfide oxidoreductase YuxK
MDPPCHVANAPSKPVMLYDGDCRFCVLWVRRWMQITGDAVDYVPLQDGSVAPRYPELVRERLEMAVHFIDTNGAIYHGAEAVFRSLAINSSWRFLLRLYQRFPLVSRTTESCYQFVAGHRSLFSWLTRMFWGEHVERADHFLARRSLRPTRCS